MVRQRPTAVSSGEKNSMAQPTLTPEERELIQGQKDLFDMGAAGCDAQSSAMQTQIDRYTGMDDAMKKFFNYNGEHTVRHYELERRWMDGQDLDTPVVEQDLLNYANNTGRLLNLADPYSLVPLRISQFDGAPLYHVNSTNEADQIVAMDTPISHLLTGYTTLSLLNTTTLTALTPSSTSVTISNTTAPLSIVPGNLLLLHDATQLAILRVQTVTPVAGPPTPPPPPPYNYVVTFTYEIMGLTSSLPIGTIVCVDHFLGFNNTERTNHVAGIVWTQPVMDQMIAVIQGCLTTRQSALTSEIAEFDANQNGDKNPSAKTNAQASFSAMSTFLGVSPPSTIDVSDLGILSMNTEKATRSGQIASRISEIASEISTGNFYNLRYNYSVNRVHRGNGTLTLLRKLTDSKTSIDAGKTVALDGSARYAAML